MKKPLNKRIYAFNQYNTNGGFLQVTGKKDDVLTDLVDAGFVSIKKDFKTNEAMKEIEGIPA